MVPRFVGVFATSKVGLMNAVLFFSYEEMSSFMLRQSAPTNNELTLAQVGLAGLMSGFASAFVTGPTELVKCIAQTNQKSSGALKEELVIFQNLFKQHGLLGTYGPTRGLNMTILR